MPRGCDPSSGKCGVASPPHSRWNSLPGSRLGTIGRHRPVAHEHRLAVGVMPGDHPAHVHGSPSDVDRVRRIMAGTVRPWATRAETYTHGHAESVLRSHRWRTVENSAAYLLPHLRPGVDLLDVGCGPGTITIDLAQRVAPGRVVGMDAAVDAIDAARGRGRRGRRRQPRADHRRRVRPRPRGRLVRRRARAPGAAAPGRPGGGAAGDAAGVPPRRRGRRTRLRLPGDELVPGVRPRSTGGSTCTARWRRPTAANPMPGATCGTGAWRPGSARWRRRPPPGASPPMRSGPGGAACGPIGSPPRRSADRAVELGLATRGDLDEMAAAWRAWAAAPDGVVRRAPRRGAGHPVAIPFGPVAWRAPPRRRRRRHHRDHPEPSRPAQRPVARPHARAAGRARAGDAGGWW